MMKENIVEITGKVLKNKLLHILASAKTKALDAKISKSKAKSFSHRNRVVRWSFNVLLGVHANGLSLQKTIVYTEALHLARLLADQRSAASTNFTRTNEPIRNRFGQVVPTILSSTWEF